MSQRDQDKPFLALPGRAGPSAESARRDFLRFTALGFGSAVLGGGLLAGCGGGGSDSLQPRESAQTGGGTGGEPEKCEPTVWDLTAGQTHVVGTVSVTNDATNLYITYRITEPGCTLGQLHAWVGTDLAQLRKNPAGILVPGQFPYKPDAGGATSYTLTIPLSSLDIDLEEQCGKLKLFIVTHAEVTCNGKKETAFGGDIPVNVSEPGRWWFYGEYLLCCPPENGDGDGEETCETAYAKGTHSFIDLGIGRNWGWAIHLDEPGTSFYPIWAGAGQNDTTKGHLVGQLKVEWNGSTAKVTYMLEEGCKLQEAHLYARDAKPTKAAPGQYGYKADLGGTEQHHTFTVNLSDAGKDGVWLIAHAVVCCKKKTKKS